jgi:hypothetical protein
MGFDITSGTAGFGDALLLTIAISVSIPVVVWFVILIRRARADVVEDSDQDLDA